jgi:hypothetical protein
MLATVPCLWFLLQPWPLQYALITRLVLRHSRLNRVERFLKIANILPISMYITLSRDSSGAIFVPTFEYIYSRDYQFKFHRYLMVRFVIS